MSTEAHVLVRFGRWEAIDALTVPEETDTYIMTQATHHFAKGIADAVRGRVPSAETHLTSLVDLTENNPAMATRLLHNCTAQEMLAVSVALLRGEIAYRKQEFDEAWSHLRTAVAREDALPYDEPWGQMQPSRHALAGLLLEQGHVKEARTVYLEDLTPGDRGNAYPDNPWSLRGLVKCATAEGQPPEDIAHLEQRLTEASADADVAIFASCACCKAASGD